MDSNACLLASDCLNACECFKLLSSTLIPKWVSGVPIGGLRDRSVGTRLTKGRC